MSDDMKQAALAILVVVGVVLGFFIGYGDGYTRGAARERAMADREIRAMERRMDELRGELRECRRVRPATVKGDSTAWIFMDGTVFADSDSDSVWVMVDRP